MKHSFLYWFYGGALLHMQLLRLISRSVSIDFVRDLDFKYNYVLGRCSILYDPLDNNI